MKKILLVLLATLLGSAAAYADHSGERRYAVTVTNITANQTFTPLLLVSHKRSISLFRAGDAASAELATIAESGNITPMADLLNGLPDKVYATANSEGLLGPGASVTVEISATKKFDRLSLAGMLIPTNDTFVALNTVRLPRYYASHMVPAYDAGSEHNDELCANIPGPVCGGAGPSDEDGEGFVHISSGIHGIGDLEASAYDWRNPVARVAVKRIY
ncbi:MAG: spondin domain-containing protein [Gammaproteobacteria bacterium]|nr:spondin domain-containing protein [Gammaproteobacteria bacterium]